IIDDGVGMPANAPSRSVSHGLIGMRERIRQVGGVISIGSHQEPSGTVVDAFIPYPRDRKAAVRAVGN
ncbi:MAG TPA: hypothetical protein VFR96_19195, partial [Povalibacter sp.]|nr:hypothetical protein [Povalibacter sp.]